MNSGIANILKSKIENMIFVDLIAGLVRPVSKKNEAINSVGQKIYLTKTFPVSCDIDDNNCSTDDELYRLVPNSKKKSIFFFEDGGCRLRDRDRNGKHWESTLHLVGWFNTNKFLPSTCDLSNYIIQAITSAMPFDNFNAGVFIGFQVTELSQDAKTPAIFSRYTYNEFYQYLTPPFDYLGLTIKTRFTVRNSCIELISLSDAVCD